MTVHPGLRIFCEKCGHQLSASGALLFSPPDDNGRCLKTHICSNCYQQGWTHVGYSGVFRELNQMGVTPVSDSLCDKSCAGFEQCSKLHELAPSGKACKAWFPAGPHPMRVKTTVKPVSAFDGNHMTPSNDDLREKLGREVRRVWIEWAQSLPCPKPSWLVSWEGLSESDREVDRLIGETIYRLDRTLPSEPDAATQALIAIAKLCGCEQWGIPSNVVRDVEKMKSKLMTSKLYVDLAEICDKLHVWVSAAGRSGTESALVARQAEDVLTHLVGGDTVGGLIGIRTDLVAAKFELKQIRAEREETWFVLSTRCESEEHEDTIGVARAVRDRLDNAEQRVTDVEARLTSQSFKKDDGNQQEYWNSLWRKACTDRDEAKARIAEAVLYLDQVNMHDPDSEQAMSRDLRSILVPDASCEFVACDGPVCKDSCPDREFCNKEAGIVEKENP